MQLYQYFETVGPHSYLCVLQEPSPFREGVSSLAVPVALGAKFCTVVQQVHAVLVAHGIPAQALLALLVCPAASRFLRRAITKPSIISTIRRMKSMTYFTGSST